MSDHFNELLLQTLKEVSVRLERLEGRADHIINEKADKTDLDDVKTELKTVTTKLDLKADKTDLDGVKAELKADINGVETELKADINGVKTELKALTTKLDLKADKAHVDNVETALKVYINDVKAELKADINGVKTELNELRDDLRSQGQRIDRIETGIRTLQWTMTAGLAVLGIIIAFIRVF